MAGTVKEAKLDSAAARARLKRGDRKMHWRSIVAGRAHLGFQRHPTDKAGRWLLRRNIGPNKYTVVPLGLADDAQEANGDTVLSFAQADAKARAMLDRPIAGKTQLTVNQAMDAYIAFKKHQGQPTGDLRSRTEAHIRPPLGNKVVADLTAEQLRRWLFNLAASPAQVRPKAGKPQYKPEPTDEEAVRRRRASANRVLTMLKSGLNHAYDEGHVSSNSAWGRRLKPFRDVERARIRYLSVAESRRLINSCDAEFRPMARAALETGARYSELARLEVCDFDEDARVIAIRRSKGHKPRHIVLTDEGVEFFRSHVAGRAGNEMMFSHADRTQWKRSEQARPMADACKRAKITPAIGIHILRHTHGAALAMKGTPMTVIAHQLGHADTRITERHYAHLSPGYLRDTLRANAPRFGIKPDRKVVPLVKGAQ